MALATPISTAFETALADRTSPKWWRLLVDTDEDTVLEDVTDKLVGGLTVTRRKGGASGEGVSNSAQAKLRNSDGSLAEGDWAGLPAAVEAKVGASSEYIRVFTGWVSSGGLKRTQTYLTSDEITLELVDAVERAATRRKVDPTIYINHTICDTTTTSNSLVHKIAAAMGLDAADLDVEGLAYTKDYLAVGENATAWSELKLIAAQYLGFLTFRYDGKLRLHSKLQTGYTAPTAEWTLDSTNVHSIAAVQIPVQCNRVKTEFESYRQLDERVVYKSTEGYDTATGQTDIAVAAGAYWPGTSAGSKAQLQYRDPKSGEQWPLAINIQTPTINTTGSGADIEYTGGTLELVSFNGSTSATRQLPDRSEIILRNAGGSTCTITKLTIRGEPLRVQKQIQVEAIDATVSNDWEYVDKSINGKYAATETQAWLTCRWWRDWGEVPRRRYELKTDFLPQLQEGCVVQFNHPTNAAASGEYTVDSVEHPAVSAPIDRRQYSTLTLTEIEAFDDTGSPDDVVEDHPGEAAPEEQDDTATFDDLNDGWDKGSGTTTPTAPTAEARAYFKAISVTWSKQVSLTNFDHYEVQVSDDDATWYALRFDGTDWKAGVGGLTETTDEVIIHQNIPPGGTDDEPTGRTLYYRVRQETKDGTTSAWSSSVSATTTGIDTVDIQPDAITAPKILAGAVTADKVSAAFLNAVIAEITGQLEVTSEGLVGHVSDSARVLITGTKLSFQLDIAGSWVDRITLGGNPDATLPDLIRAQGLVKTGASVDGLDVGDAAPAGSTRFDFDNDYLDEDDTDPWDTKTALAFTTNSRFGSHALTTGSADGRLVDNDAQGIALDTDFSIAAWTYAASLPGSAQIIARLHGVPSWTDVAATFASPDSTLTGLAYDAATGNLISVDAGTKLIYIHDGISATTSSSFAIPGGSNFASGLAVDPATGNLLSNDYGTDLIYVHDGISSTVLSTITAPETSVQGIAVDPFTGNLICSASGSNTIYVHSGLTSTVSSSFTVAAGGESCEVDPYTGDLVVLDYSGEKIRVYEGISSTLKAQFDTPNPSAYGTTLPRGLTFNIETGDLIVGDRYNDEIHRLGILLVTVSHDGSNNLELEWDGPDAQVTRTAAITAGWTYFSVHFDTSADEIAIVVDDSLQTALDVSADTALTHGMALELLLPSTDYRLDDLLVMPAALLSTTESIAHYNGGYAWAESDFDKDLYYVARSTGVHRFIGDVVMGDLPTASAGLPVGALWNDAGTVKVVT